MIRKRVNAVHEQSTGWRREGMENTLSPPYSPWKGSPEIPWPLPRSLQSPSQVLSLGFGIFFLLIFPCSWPKRSCSDKVHE